MASASNAVRPLPRAYHAAVLSARHEQLFIWGGLDIKLGKSKPLISGVDIFNTSKEVWERKETKGKEPPGSAVGSYTLLGDSLYYFGGRKSLKNDSFDNTIRRVNFQINEPRWEIITAKNPAEAPKRKCGSGMVTCGKDRIAVFAGVARGPTLTNDVDIFNIVERECHACILMLKT